MVQQDCFLRTGKNGLKRHNLGSDKNLTFNIYNYITFNFITFTYTEVKCQIVESAEQKAMKIVDRFIEGSF